MGVWIETSITLIFNYSFLSLLMWECGLKLYFAIQGYVPVAVTPYVGVWIETKP